MNNFFSCRLMSTCVVAFFYLTACDDRQLARIDPASKIYVQIPRDVYADLEALGVDFIADHKVTEDVAFGWISQVEFMRLPPAVHAKITVEEEQESPSEETRENGYHDYLELTEILSQFRAEYPELLSLHSAGQSEQGRELWYVKISDSPETEEEEPKFLYIANMHGNEVVGREVMLKFIERLITTYHSDQRVKSLVDHSQLYIMPSMNPDGFELGRRFNAEGYDLNRNFPDPSVGEADSAEGKAAETRAVMQLHDEHEFHASLNFHGGQLCVNIPWDHRANINSEERFPDDALMTQLARTYADTNTVMHLNTEFDRGVTYGYEWFHVVGTMQDWAAYYRNSVHATVELTELYWPAYRTIEGFWRENSDALLRYLEDAMVGVHVRVTNPDGEGINNVRVNLSSAPRKWSTHPDGIVHRPALSGTHTVIFEADGYEARSVSISSSRFAGVHGSVVLTPMD
jgi:hypothetical protein